MTSARILFIAMAALWASAQAEEQVSVLVANPAFGDPAYERSVVVLQRGGEEVGVIINRPSEHALASVVAAPAATKFVDPVHMGGPFLSGQLLVLVRDPQSPGAGSIELARGLHLSISAAVIERSAERSAGTTRYYAGLVLWRRGELAEEVKRGLWHRLEVRVDTVFRHDSAELWEELMLLVQRLRATLAASPRAG